MMSESEVEIMSESDFEEENLSDDDESFMENDAPVPSKSKAAKAPAKKAPAKKKTALGQNKNADNVVVMEEIEIDPVVEKPASAAASKSKKTKTVEETYQKKSQLEHILLRPDTYIGSTQRLTQNMFVLDADKEKIVEREITYTPGLYKIFDEIVVNAADNKQRDLNMSELHIEVDAENNFVSVKNNGNGIPVAMHKEHNCYVPTLIFGHLLTGSNFDDDEKKTTGGRNGYGAKLANIFSKEFTVECVDSSKGLKFKQIFRNNMTVAEEPVVKPCSATEKKKGDYTKISFKPDLERFNMESLDKDSVDLLSKRAYDIAGSMASRHGKKLAVTLNGTKLPVKSFQDYVKLFEGINPPAAFEKVGERWEVGVTNSIDGVPQQISFVNAISTSKGGGHITYVVDQLVDHLKKTVKKKNKGGTDIKPAQIKNHLCVFVNCLVENPTFDSQTKENCTTRPKQFGDECKLSDKFFKQVDKSQVVEDILSYAQFKQKQDLKRKGGTKKIKLTGIAKLDDANFAGGAKSKDCTLIVTEGDSAKTLAMSGLSVVGRDYYGVFPLRGKLLNVRDAAHSAIMKNEEIKNLIDILGLKFGVVYNEENIKTLRYGHLMIMADQDSDGSHIKGLVINFIHNFWPSLLDVPGFMKQFITPIVKATKPRANGQDIVKTFFTIPEFEKWCKTDPAAKNYQIKYYKGLGTSTSEEAKEYFDQLDDHEVLFARLADDMKPAATLYGENVANVLDVDTDENGELIVPDKTVSGSDLLDMVFKKNRVEDRKKWLNNLQDETWLDYKAAQSYGVRYSDFVNRELILFSRYDCQRSIPHFVDGFKPSQRKVLFACFKKNLTKKELKVSQLAGYIGEQTAYHHGEASLQGTIINMAQTFVGSNNVNLLAPKGQFGTRRMGGKDHASPRYIYTKLEKVARAIFHPDDDELLNYLEDDGDSVEPETYVPVLPMALVNGSDGIGTGWSSTVPNYCPRQIISNLRKMINGEPTEELYPNYTGFNGVITPKGQNSYQVEGTIERTDATTLKITELPLRKWTQDYKVFLEKMMEGDSKNPPELKDFKEYHTDTTVSFVLNAEASKIDAWERGKDGLMGKFKLITSISTNNMHFFDTDKKITKYESPEAIMKAFYDIRLEYYVKRKALLIEKIEKEKRILENKARFVQEVCDGDLVVSNRKRKELLADLKERGYELFPKDPKKKASGDAEGEVSDVEDDDVALADLAKGYDYLLSMRIWTLTYEKVEQLCRQLADKSAELEELRATEPTQIWLNDLNNVETALDERDEEIQKNAQKEKTARKKASSNRQKGKKKAAVTKKAAKKKKTEWDSDMEDSEDEKEIDLLDDNSVEYIPPKTTTSRAKKVPAKAPVAAKKLAAKEKKAPPKALAAAATPPGPKEEVDDIEMSLLDRMKNKLMVSPPGKSKKAKKRDSLSSEEGSSASAGSKRPSPKEHDDAFDFVDSNDQSKPTTKKAKKTVSKPTKKAPAKTAPVKNASAKKKIIDDSKSKREDDFLDGDDSSVEVEEMDAPAPRARSGRARKPITYDIGDSNDSDFGFDD